MTIKIYDSNGNYFRTLVPTADNQVVWDGTNDDGELASVEGDYRVEVTLEDEFGNTVIRNANIVVYR